jgi:hypothetical protein
MKHKFLASGARGPLSGFVWPTPAGGAPGAWVEVEGNLDACRRGVHVCDAPDLAHWIHDELWALETEGESIAGTDCIVVRRARLVRRIDAWSTGAAQRFADACIEHASSQTSARPDVFALLDDARTMAAHGYPALCAYTTAVAVGRSDPEGDIEAHYRRERAWQSKWIADHCAL